MPKQSQSYPKRGEVFIANLDPSFGREIHKKRPVLVISNNIINQTFPVVTIIPFSSIVPQLNGPDIVRISPHKGMEIKEESIAVVNQIRSIDKERLIKKVGILSTDKLEEVEQALKLVLGLANLD
ncbi:MAG: type II toxin-antitoxin system PemK/MazF family toxin [Candidatus Blackburnbacteria bacterium]|nr:type II toxin-antitoxin system PemK/MazF family toxin [Candidatus Blackburnbacteria bacterium]